MDSLTFIIPAYNDAGTVETVVKKAIKTGTSLRVPYSLLIINDASTDNTGAILKTLAKKNKHIRVITHTVNKGYGGTIKELYEKAGGTWMFSIPGDYQIEPYELTKLWTHRGEADMIIGRRNNRRDNPARLRQSAVYNALLRILFGLSVSDVNSVRLMKTTVMDSVHLSTTSAFVDAELVIRAKRAGLRIIEIPVAHRARAGFGASGGKISTILPTILDMIRFIL